MIQNLFFYPGNFGKLSLYKCDYFGNSLSKQRFCFVDNFEVNVEQQNVNDEMLFGSIAQTPNFMLSNRNINIKTTFMFSLDLTGTLNPAIDLLVNASAWAYQGTQASYKITGTTVTTSSTVQITYSQTQLITFLNSQYSLTNFNWYAVSDTYSIPLTFVSINPVTSVLNFNCVTQPSGAFWVEAFYYNHIPLYIEPQLRLDCSEGSFYPCMIDKIDFMFTDDFIKVNCNIVSINYDRSTRYNFVNSTSVKNIFSDVKLVPPIKALVKDYKNDITNNFLLTDIKQTDYMSSLITQSFSATPIKEISLSIENNLQPVYTNHYDHLKRTYVSGYISKSKKVHGSLVIYALRSTQPTFDRYPTLSGITGNSLSLYIDNQTLIIPYTVWSPGKLEVKQNDWVTLGFNWFAPTNSRQGQPMFGYSGITTS